MPGGGFSFCYPSSCLTLRCVARAAASERCSSPLNTTEVILDYELGLVASEAATVIRRLKTLEDGMLCSRLIVTMRASGIGRRFD